MYAALALSPRLPELVDVGWALVEGASARAVDPARNEGAVPFVALRWAPGSPLGEGAAGARVEAALGAARDVGDALADLHEMGVAHGDVKPANLIASGDRAGDRPRAGRPDPRNSGGGRDAALPRSRRGVARGRAGAGSGGARRGARRARRSRGRARGGSHRRGARSPLARRARGDLRGPARAEPGARPSATWVAATARAALRAGGAHAEDPPRATRDARRVRASYLKLRRDRLDRASSASDDAAPWLAEAAAQAARARSIAARHVGAAGITLGPLPPDQRARWLTALVGSAAAAWPLASLAAVPSARWRRR